MVAPLLENDHAFVPAQRLQGSFMSPFLDGRPAPRATGTARGSTLTIRGSTYKLTSGIYGLLGQARISGETIEFHSPTGYFKLPKLTSGVGTDPDPLNVCPGARGLYRWHSDGRTLQFSAVRDPCTARKDQLERAPWTHEE